MLKLKKIFFLLILLFFITGELSIGGINKTWNNELEQNQSYHGEKQKKSIIGDWISYSITQSKINIGDGIVDDGWTLIPEYFVEEYTGTTTEGWVKSVHDDFYIYVLIAYPLEAKWISVELNATDNSETSMKLNNDGWVFGEGTNIPDGELNPIEWEGDVSFIGKSSHPKQDNRNDLTFEYVSNEEIGIRYVEIRRPLNTQDPNGFDFTFIENSIFNVKFASSLNPKYHKNGGFPYLMNITPEIFEEISNDTTQTTTSQRGPTEIRADNEFQLITFSTIGLLINFTLIILIIVFHRKE